MRVLIIGAGRASWRLTEQLCRDKHDVVVVDRDAQALADLEDRVDVMTVRGNGADPAVLQKADVGRADLVVALTNRDEINVVASLIARQAGAPGCVARIDSQSLSDPDRFDLEAAGIDLVVGKTTAIANELTNILLYRGTREVIDVFDGRAKVVGFPVSLESPFLRAPLQDALDPELLGNLRMIAVLRGEDLIIPRGDTQPIIGDDIYLACRREHIDALLERCLPEHAAFDRFVIAGGSRLGLTLAERLEASHSKITLIEKDRVIAMRCSTRLRKALVMHGDALDEEMLHDVGLTQNTAFVAATGSDEHNMILCLLAEKLGAPFTTAQISKPEYTSIINSQSLLDRAVSSYVAMSNAILHFMRGKHLKCPSVLHRLPGELLEVTVPGNHRWADKAIQEIKFPTGTVVAVVDRDDACHIATGSFVLRPHDRLLLFTETRSVKKVASLFGA